MREFFDPDRPSCTGWIAHIASTKFCMDVTPLTELIHWADIVDGAKYDSAQAAVEMGAPAMKITMVIESAPSSAETGSALVQRFIPLLTAMPLAEIVAQPFVQELLGPLMERHRAGIELLRERAHCERGVISFDITDQPTEGFNKFIPYYLHPEGTYTVAVSPSSFRTKISVGSNPWAPVAPKHNLATICERYGGGGHARVGAISLEPGQVDEARRIAAEVAAELRS
jgi:hypothetical protein